MNRYIISVRQDVAPGDVAAEWIEAGGVIVNLLHVSKGFIIDIDDELVDGLSNDDRIVAVVQDVDVDGDEVFVPIKTTGSSGSHAKRRMSQRVTTPLGTYYRRWADGEGVVVYVIDSGINHDHSQFTGRITQGYAGANPLLPIREHGTLVAGAVGASISGVATAVSIVDCNIVNDANEQKLSGVAAALNWVAANHPENTPGIVVMSLMNTDNYSPIVDGVNAVLDRGMFMAKSAGNNNERLTGPVPAISETRPLLVCGEAEYASDYKSAESNYGPLVEIFAPSPAGTVSPTSNTSTATLVGTSAAAPQVAGIAAIIMEMYPGISAEEVKSKIIGTATKGMIEGISYDTPNNLAYMPVYNNDSWKEITRTPTSNESWLDEEVSPDKSYRYRVTPVYPDGEPGEPSSWIFPQGESVDDNLTVFDSYAVGEAPVGWTDLWASSTPVIKEDSLAAGGRVLERTSSGNSRKFYAWTDIGPHADAEVLVRLKFAAKGSNDVRIMLRGGGSAGNELAYFAEMRGSSGVEELRVLYYSPSGYYTATNGIAAFPFEADTYYQVRFRVNGDSLSAKVWADGDPEPSEWMIDTTATAVPDPGFIGFGEWRATWHVYDAISVGLDGDEAPALPPRPVGINITTPPELTLFGVSSGSAAISWEQVIGATEFRVEFSENNQAWETYETTASREIVLMGLESLTDYRVRVIPINSNGEDGASSAELSFTTDPPVLGTNPNLRTFVNDFVGLEPPGWEKLKDATAVNLIVEEDPTALGGKVMHIERTTDVGGQTVVYAGGGSADVMDVRTRFKLPDLPLNTFKLLASAANEADPADPSPHARAMEMRVSSTSGPYVRGRTYFGNTSSSAPTNYLPIEINKWYQARIKVLPGAEIGYKIWPDDEDEPFDWLSVWLPVESHRVMSGMPGIGVDDTDVYIDAFSFGLNGEDAPVLPGVGDSTSIEDAPVLTAEAIGPEVVHLQWTGLPEAEGYLIYRDDVLIAQTYFNTTHYVDTEAPSGSSVSYYVAGANGFGEGPASVTAQVATPMPLTDTLVTFNNSTPGELPPGWIQLWSNELHAKVVNNEESTDGSMLWLVPRSRADNALIYTLTGKTSTVDTRMRFRVNGTSGERGHLFALVSGKAGDENGVALYVDNVGGAFVALVSYEDGTLNSLADAEWFTYASGQWLQSRIKVDGSSIRGKIWLDGDSEPSTWTFDTTLSYSFEPGYAGIGSLEEFAALEVDAFSVSTTGDSASLPARPAKPSDHMTIAPVTGLNIEQDNTQVLISWDDEPLAEFRVYRDDELIATTSDSLVVDEPDAGTYEYSVVARRTVAGGTK